MELPQVKSKQRVADHGEVYTNPREVNAMLNLVKEQSFSLSATFLEPACGNGNFLIEILRASSAPLLSSTASSLWRMTPICYRLWVASMG